MMKTLFETSTADFRPLKEFPLKWRWTDERWHSLSPEIIQRIKPLSESKAFELSNFHRQFFDFDKTAVETLHAESAEIAEVENWLLGRIGDETEIYISWDEKWAVQTTAEIFSCYWNTFCYPASDNVTISAATLKWILSYHHDEVFSFEILND